VHSAHDPVGAASARLLAAGVPRPDRLFALRVLGLLLDHADRNGVVRLHPGMLAGEFTLDRLRVEAAYLRLRAAGVLLPAPDGWRIDEFDGYQSGGVNAGAALELIAHLLEEPERPVTHPAPVLAPAPAPAPRTAHRSPVLAGVAVLLMVVVAAAARPSDPEVALRVAGAMRVEAGEERREPQPVTRFDRRTVWSPTTAAPSPSASLPSSAPAPTATATTSAPPAVTSADAITAVAEIAKLPACPTGRPVVTVDDVDALIVPAEAIAPAVGHTTSVGRTPGAGQASWRVTVKGTAVNGAKRALVLEAFDVVVTTADGDQEVHALEEPLRLAPGASHEWEVVTTTPLTSPPPDEGDVEVVVRSWRWAAGCSSS